MFFVMSDIHFFTVTRLAKKTGRICNSFCVSARRAFHANAYFSRVFSVIFFKDTVFNGMFTPCCNFEIFNSIIELVPILVMDALMAIKLATKKFFHHFSMLEHIFTGKSITLSDQNKTISVRAYRSATFPLVVFFASARCRHFFSRFQRKLISSGFPKGPRFLAHSGDGHLASSFIGWMFPFIPSNLRAFESLIPGSFLHA